MWLDKRGQGTEAQFYGFLQNHRTKVTVYKLYVDCRMSVYVRVRVSVIHF